MINMGYLMLNLFKCNPHFDFSSNQLKTHAFNVKLISEWFLSDGLSLGNCMELLAHGCGFHTYATVVQSFKENFNSEGELIAPAPYDFTQDKETYFKRLKNSPSYKLLVSNYDPKPVMQFLNMTASYMHEVGIDLNLNFDECKLQGTFLFAKLGQLRRMIPMLADNQSFIDFAILNTISVQNPELDKKAKALLSGDPDKANCRLCLYTPQDNSNEPFLVSLTCFNAYNITEPNNADLSAVAHLDDEFEFYTFNAVIPLQLLVLLDFQTDHANPVNVFADVPIKTKGLPVNQPHVVISAAPREKDQLAIDCMDQKVYNLFQNILVKDNLILAMTESVNDFTDFLSKVPVEYGSQSDEISVAFRMPITMRYTHVIPSIVSKGPKPTMDLIFTGPMAINIFVDQSGKTRCSATYQHFNSKPNTIIASVECHGLEGFDTPYTILLPTLTALGYITYAADMITLNGNRNTYELEYIRSLLTARRNKIAS